MESNPKRIEGNFVPLQVQARLSNPVALVSLCPSMDLVAIGLRSTTTNTSTTTTTNITTTNITNVPLASSVVIYRSIGWQKLMTIGSSDLSTPEQELEPILLKEQEQSEQDEQDDVHDNDTTTHSIACMKWSPDGRQLVLGLSHGRVLLYNIETISYFSKDDISDVATTIATMSHTHHSSSSSTTTNNNNSHATIHTETNLHQPQSNSIHSILVLPTLKYLKKQYHYSSSWNETNEHDTTTTTTTATTTTTTTNNNTNGIIMTRSMTLARQKRMMRMNGKTPNAKQEQQEQQQVRQPPVTQEGETLSSSKSSSSSSSPSSSSLQSSILLPMDIQWQRIREPNSNTFQLQSIYLDKQYTFLPKCQYLDQLQSNHPLPKAVTPLSILVIRSMTDGYIHYYAHGRYRLLSIPILSPSHSGGTTTSSSSSSSSMTVDSNFQTSILSTHHPIQLIHIPLLTKQRYNIQYISHFYSHMTNHIQTISKGMKDVSNTWSTAIKQLDMKFDQLRTLLVKYGVIIMDGDNNGMKEKHTPAKDMKSIRMELLNYILGGHSSRLENTCNAMDQFFTHPLMNDQLLLRMFKSCETNVMTVEQMFRKQIMGPIRSFLFDAGELNGIVTSMNQMDSLMSSSSSPSSSSPSLIQLETCQRLVQATKVLFTVAEQCLSQIVEVRYRLDCLMKWIRSTASLVKAKGTAADSVQRQNARKRLVSEQVLRKVADFLSTPLKTDENDVSSKEEVKYGSTECMLGILLTDYFHKSSVYVEKSGRTSVFFTNHRTATDANSSFDGFHTFVKSPSLKEVLQVITDVYSDLFEEPRTVLHQNVKTRRFTIQECIGQDDIVSAIHTRFRSSHVKKYKNVLSDDKDVFECNTHWTVVANTCKSLSSDGCQQVQITAIPTGTSLRQDSDDHSTDLLLYKSTLVSVPENCTVSSIQFYGDDGNSTLTSETSPSYKEGRQSLGILLRRRDGFLSNVFDEEIMLFQYDNLNYTSHFASGDDGNIDDFVVNKDCHYSGRLAPENSLEHDDDDDISSMDDGDEDERKGLIGCRWRKIRSNVSLEYGKYSQMVLSGSRGVGGVFSNEASTIDLYDLEDDEEDDDEDDDDEDDDDNDENM